MLTKKPRILKIAICSRCKRQREIYQVRKQLCSSCRQLESLYNNPERYKKYLEKQKIKNSKIADKIEMLEKIKKWELQRKKLIK